MLQRLMVQNSPPLPQQQAPATHMWIPSSATEGAVPMGNAQNEQRMGSDASSLSSSGEILIHNSNNSNNNNNNNCHADSRDSLSNANHKPVAHSNGSSPLLSPLSAPMRIPPLCFSASVSSHDHLQLSRPLTSSTSLFRAISDSQSTFLWNQHPRPGLVCQNSFSPVGGGKSELCLKQPSQSQTQTPQHLPQRFNRFPDQ